ncbi:uncharacterized protein LOC141832474 [Curcuma longa]|uniref:uncharacterized protein LOC141832474 n=1 Tax=Curcuma longa TaxID=136217 RepID=UPI003D9EDA4D
MSSECSGCQSGWTIYLVHSSDDQSSQLSHKHGGRFQPEEEEEEEEEEEDLSMVSDASSWPPHFDGDGYCSAPAAPTDGGKKRRAAAEQPPKLQHAVLEDTASSSQLFSNINKSKRPVQELQLDSSCDLSTTQSKAKPSQPQQDHRERGN